MSVINKSMATNAFSMGDFVWFYGVIEDRHDPEKLGRLKIRIYGYHDEDKEKISTDDLFWAAVMSPIQSSSFGGVGFSPTGILEGTTVVGFFLDGHNAQNPVVIGTIYGKPEKPKQDKGFWDPKGVYTRYDAGEQDTNRCARNEQTDKTPVKWRRDRVDTADKAFGGQWKEPPTPYAAQYPYNHVYESEPKPHVDVSGSSPPDNCGHWQEFDDTPGAERIYLQHKKGTFTEIHPDGKEIHRVVHERHVIIEKDEHLHVWGNGMCTIDGNNHLLIKGNSFIEVLGNCKEYIHGNYELHVGGNYDVQVDGHHYDNSNVHRRITAPRIDLN